ncbi:MAG: complex I NDUFA9 subunit family protein [Proteobacteria bacterium]|nr:complex I NDUFA9 subunit family protein [Pseudomonadota bacterium]
MSNRLVTIFGASGQVGRAIVERLCHHGYRIRATSRHPNEALFLKPFGDPGQVQTTFADISREETVIKAIEGASIVINCVGILYESRGRQKFQALQAEGAAAIAKAAKKEGARTLIHISAIGADQHSPSQYARTKWQGEKAVKAAFPKAVILRPSIIFGPNDSFFNLFAKMAKIPVLPIPVVGPKTRFQPVYVEDVAEAVIRAVMNSGKYQGNIYQLGGPEVYTFRELLDYMLEVIGVKKFIAPIPFPMAGFFGWWFQLWAKFLPITPPLTLDQVQLLKNDNVVSATAKGFEAFGIKPTSITSVVPGYLVRFRPRGRFT